MHWKKRDNNKLLQLLSCPKNISVDPKRDQIPNSFGQPNQILREMFTTPLHIKSKNVLLLIKNGEKILLFRNS